MTKLIDVFRGQSPAVKAIVLTVFQKEQHWYFLQVSPVQVTSKLKFVKNLTNLFWFS